MKVEGYFKNHLNVFLLNGNKFTEKSLKSIELILNIRSVLSISSEIHLNRKKGKEIALYHMKSNWPA